MSDAVHALACLAHKVPGIFEKTTTRITGSAVITATDGLLVSGSFSKFPPLFVAIANRARELLFFACASFATVDRGCILSNTHNCQICEAQSFGTIVALPYFELCVLSNRVLAFAAS